MKNYLVTGGAGFIGSHVVERLFDEGNRVVVLDNFNDFYDYRVKLKNLADAVKFIPNFKGLDQEIDISSFAKDAKTDRFELVYGDIRDQKCLKDIFDKNRFDMVIHLAALAGVRPSIDNPLLYEEVNVKGTMNILEACKEFRVNKFINASSSSVYGNNERVPFAETDVVDYAISPYAATKKATEVLGHVYYHLYKIDMLHLRFFTVYGPRQRPDLAIHKFTKLIYENSEIPFYGNGESGRDYTFIDDIIDGIFQSIDYLFNNTEVYEILNLGESKVITLIEMVAAIEYFTNKKADIHKLPSQPGDVNLTYADISKAENLIGYKPQIDFNQGIQKFVQWFKENP